jgi:peroxiredoxin
MTSKAATQNAPTAGTLADAIAKFQAGMLPTIPGDVLQALQQAGQEIAALGIENRALRSGDRCPGFRLENAQGREITSEQLLKTPLVISFYRGAWCPYCNLEIRALSEALPDIRAQGAELVAITPQRPEKSLHQVSDTHIEFEVLSDIGNRLAKEFGLVFTLPESLRPIYQAWGVDLPEYNGDQSFQLPVPATYLVDRDGLIRHHYVNSDYTQRMEPAIIVEQLSLMQTR